MDEVDPSTGPEGGAPGGETGEGKRNGGEPLRPLGPFPPQGIADRVRRRTLIRALQYYAWHGRHHLAQVVGAIRSQSPADA